LGGQGALAATGIQEFTLDGTFVKQHNVSVDTWQSVDTFHVTDDYIIASNPDTGRSGFTREGSVTFLDRNTGTKRVLYSPDPGAWKCFGQSAYIQGNQLIVGESSFFKGNLWSGNTLIGYRTVEGDVDLAT
ncbi:MAG: hypothetical protein ACKO96_29065, partial [Flammeovirgaceae bacterium]